jgi:hypothetical protein
VAGVAASLRAHLSSKLKASVVTEVTDSLPQLLDALTQRRESRPSADSSPKRDISSGGFLLLTERTATGPYYLCPLEWLDHSVGP